VRPETGSGFENRLESSEETRMIEDQPNSFLAFDSVAGQDLNQQVSGWVQPRTLQDPGTSPRYGNRGRHRCSSAATHVALNIGNRESNEAVAAEDTDGEVDELGEASLWHGCFGVDRQHRRLAPIQPLNFITTDVRGSVASVMYRY